MINLSIKVWFDNWNEANCHWSDQVQVQDTTYWIYDQTGRGV